MLVRNQYTFELIGKLLYDYFVAVWDDPMDPLVYAVHAFRSKKDDIDIDPVLYADQV